MLKALIAAVCLFVGAAFAEAEGCGPCGHHEHHHHHKPCCGCEGNPKYQVKRLQQVFDSIVSSNIDTSRALELALPDADVYFVAELCLPGGCCSQTLPLSNMLNFVGGARIIFDVQDIQLKHDGSVIVEDSTIISRFNVSSLATLCTFTWVPTEGCNYKIAHIDVISYACDATAGNCTLCTP